MDFSEYKIYIADDGCAASMYKKSDECPLLSKENFYEFNEGILKVQKEGRGLYLPDEYSTDEVSSFFKKTYNVWAL